MAVSRTEGVKQIESEGGSNMLLISEILFPLVRYMQMSNVIKDTCRNYMIHDRPNNNLFYRGHKGLS